MSFGQVRQLVGGSRLAAAVQAEEHRYVQLDQGTSPVVSWNEDKSQQLVHNKGFHASLDIRTAIPRPFLAYYPAIVNQSDINETINFIDGQNKISSFKTGHPTRYEELRTRDSYEPKDPKLYSCGTKQIELGEIALGRSGDKGGNLNVGFFPKNPCHWDWLRSYMTKDRIRQHIGADWDESFFIERVEFPHTLCISLFMEFWAAA